MAFIHNVLQAPAYGWKDQDGKLIKPSVLTLFLTAFSNINIFRSKKNWLPFMSWSIAVVLLPLFVVLCTYYASWWITAVCFFYAMIVMSTHGTIWLHRYSTHSAYKFSHPVWRFITQNLVIKTVPEEIYVVSHHVHHALSDTPGDPYNPLGGFFYCMLADVNHQSINKDLNEEEYQKAKNFLAHTGVVTNSYQQYLKWGSITNPFYAVGITLLNWAFWYGAFFLLGGHVIALAMFSAAMFWFVLVRAFNYTGHGSGKIKHVDGVDYDRRNLAINQTRPGWFSGEWHNNHHLYPSSARSGFLPNQLDMAWVYIYSLKKLGAVSSYQNDHKKFMENQIEKKNTLGSLPKIVTDEFK
ncbi:MAG: fatty acid desaturase [Cyclobacteriaceae bacterium]